MLCPACLTDNIDTSASCQLCGNSLGSSQASSASVVSPLQLMVGTVLKQGSYQIKRTLGQGGFGITYSAIDCRSNQTVAIKELLPEKCVRRGNVIIWPSQITSQKKREQIEEVKREALYLSQCIHPNIVKIYDAFEENETAYIVMAMVAGDSLSKLLKQYKKLPESKVKQYFIQVGEALREIHSKGLLHRDINPSNIMVDSNDKITLIDFGNAREFIAGQSRDMTRTITPGYAPLEQYSQRAKRGPATDFYAVCATMYELLTGELPPEPTERLQTDILKSPRLLESSISPYVENIILSGLSIRANDRFQTADKLIQALKMEFKTPLWALEKISEAKERKYKELDLSGNSRIGIRVGRKVTTKLQECLHEIPSEVFELVDLEHLNLSHNQIIEVSNSIAKLKKLKELNLSGNEIINIFDAISQMTNLSNLDLSHNQITHISDHLTQLTTITVLDLSHNQISAVSKEIFKLKNLEALHLGFNQLRYFPSEINSQDRLHWLNLESNELKALPSSIASLPNLTHLNLRSNQFNMIPESIYQLKHLLDLNLSSQTGSCLVCDSFNSKGLEFCNSCGSELLDNCNSICKISPDILNLEKLHTLNLDGNPVNEPPSEILRRGVQAIRNYFRQLKFEGQSTLYEAKLLIVGEPGAGKTSLAKKIADSSYQLLPNEPSTEGIDVTLYHFPISNNDVFRLHIWDFGGQEIYHSTHQFFLTKRSLYVLLVDNRKEDTDFDYWLNIVALLSDDSPLIIIQNEQQDRKRDVPNESQLRGQFSNFKETLSTNLLNDRGLDKVLEAIQHYITKLPHLGQALPTNWVKVRTALRDDPRDYISLDEYFDICQQNGFTEQSTKLQLIQYLHDIGVCLHFQDDDLLRKTVILNPNWGTAAVYQVLDNEEVRINQGHFTRNDLAQIWSDNVYANMQGELLRLMCKFQLCYQIPTNLGNYIAPQLLRDKQPEFPWDSDKNLILRYTYEFMPKGIITRFIVTLHEKIHEQKYVWKSGVILSQDDAKAEVVEYYSKREIKIRVSGTSKRDLMAIIIHEIDRIHEQYKQLKYEKRVPCNCPACEGSQTPSFYPYTQLRERISKGKKTIECTNSPYLDVYVSDLLEGIESSKTPPRTNNLQQQRNDQEIASLQMFYDTLSEKLHQIRLDLAKETGTSTIFQLEQEMKQIELKRSVIEQQLKDLES